MDIKKIIITLVMMVTFCGSVAGGVLGADVPNYGEEWEGADHVPPPEYGEEWEGSKTNGNIISNLPDSPSFSDVPPTHWAYQYIEGCRAMNLVDGYLDGSFRPENTITRSEALKVCVLEMGLELISPQEPTFSDVSSSSWYYTYVETGKNLLPYRNNIQGIGCFMPEEAITREDVVYMLVNSLGYSRYVQSVDYSVLNEFSDRGTISSDIEAYMAIAVKYNLIDGYDNGTLMPKNNLTRAEFTALLYRARQQR